MSKETKFTKGNLIIDSEENTCFFNILEDEGDGYFFMVAENVTCLADAKLFKTAPKLYTEIESEIEFLTKLMKDNFTVNCTQSYEISERLDSLNKALVEARGEQ